MAYNRWLSQDYLAHHGVKGQKWGERNGPPYPLDSSKSDGHKLLSGSGSPQGKKKYKTSEKTSHQRAERKARTDRELDRARKLYGKDDISEAELAALRRAKKDIESHRITDPEMRELIEMDQMDHVDDETYSAWDSSEKTQSIKNAKDNDMWELDFLEYTQNEEWANSLSPRFDKKRKLKEYAEYLDDRDAYSQKRLPKEQRKTGDEIRTMRFKATFKQKYGRDFDEKVANDISQFPAKKLLWSGKYIRDAKQDKKRRDFERIVDDMPFSDGYTKAVKKLNEFAKKLDYDEYGKIRSDYERHQVRSLLHDVDKEAYKMLGLDEDKLDPIARVYMAESIRNAYWKKYKE